MAEEKEKKKFTIAEVAKELESLQVSIGINDNGQMEWKKLSDQEKNILRELANMANTMRIAQVLERIEDELKFTREELNQTLNQIWAELAARPKENKNESDK